MTADLEQRRKRTERWFVRQGLPHLIADYSVRDDVLTRMAPFLTLVVLLEFALTFGDRWSGWGQAGAFMVSVVATVAAFTIVNRLRGRPRWALPDRVGVPEVLLYLLLPMVPAGVGAEGAVGDDILAVLGVNVALFAVAFLVTRWGLLPMLRWSVGQMWRQLGGVVDLAMASLPILLIFSAFIFLNAEMWQVANDFTLPFFGSVVAVVALVGGAFVLTSVRRLTLDLARFARWDDIRARCGATPVADLVPDDDAPPPSTPPLTRRAGWNVALLLFVAQTIQILLVAGVITLFYLVFGLLTVRETTLLQWTAATELSRDADWVLRWGVLGGELVFTRQLVLVSAFIGLMSGLFFTVQVVTDDDYRAEFAEGMTEEIREALAVRAVYHRVLVPTETP